MQTFFLQPVYQGFTPYYVVPFFKNKFFIHQKYVAEGLSVKQIAKEILCSRMAVLDALAMFRIPIREPHYHHDNPSQPQYGQRISKNILVDHKIEQKIILIIRELHEQGFSLRIIAGILNGMRVATKCSGNGWHPEMVRECLRLAMLLTADSFVTFKPMLLLTTANFRLFKTIYLTDNFQHFLNPAKRRATKLIIEKTIFLG